MNPQNVGSARLGDLVAAGLLGRFTTWNTYYSSAQYAATVAGAGPFTYAFASGAKRRLFGYAIGDQVEGFPNPTLATFAETNLSKKGSTENETVYIHGVSVMINGQSDATLVKLLVEVISCKFAVNGENMAFKLGRPDMIPCGGGLTGIGDSYVTVPALNESLQTRSGNLTNGIPHSGNFLPFPEPIVWTTHAEDSLLLFMMEIERAFTYTTIGGIGDRVAAAGVAAWTHPAAAALGSFVNFTVRLWSQQEAVRSQNR